MKRILFILMVALLGACGKNDAISSYPNQGYTYQAPPPSTQFPMPPGYQQGPVFQPQLPQGMPPQYTPFLPIHYYFQQNAQMQAYWQGVWAGWLQYAAMRSYSPYQFGAFWTEYCPNTTFAGPYSQAFVYYDTTFYNWVTPSYSCSPYVQPATYWQNYAGYCY